MFSHNNMLVFLFNCMLFYVSCGNIPYSEMAALNDLYSATEGLNWYCCREGEIAWNFSSYDNNPCADSWQGVVCNNSSVLTVTKVQLLDHNLVGTIPYSLKDLRNLKVLDLGSNSLTSSIPSSICELSHLESIFLVGNHLTSTLPSLIGTLTNLIEFWIVDNMLTGTIPSSVGQLTNLVSIELENNLLTGTLPSLLGNLSSLATFYVDSNLFTSTIPSSLGNLTDVKFFYVDGNMLSGTIPRSLAKLKKLEYLELSYNYFSGSVPTWLGQWQSLKQIIISENYFSGNLDDVFVDSLTDLRNIQMNNNDITGTIPANIFFLPAVVSFIATSNCFHGTLPFNICNVNLTALLMDGLSSSASCQRTILPKSWSASYITRQSVYGTIPVCLFQLPLISTLHLSGNAFTGSLPSPADHALSTSITDLSLSHNFLKGPIGTEFLSHDWLNIDVSYNSLSGVLDDQAQGSSNSTSLSIENNRISGSIPNRLSNKQQLSILGSNLFACNYDESDLPVHDSDKSEYTCASNAFDVCGFMWLFSVCVACGTTLYLYRTYFVGETVTDEKGWVKKSIDSMRMNLAVTKGPILMVFNLILNVTTVCIIYILLLLVPLYVVLSSFYGTYTHQYAYVVSAAYLSGVVPFGCEFGLWIGLIVIILLMLRRIVNSDSITDGEYFVMKYGYTSGTWDRYVFYAAYFLVNLVFVLGANFLYVYLFIYTDHSFVLLLFEQVVLSLFKLFWNKVGSPYLLFNIAKLVIPGSVAADNFRMRNLHLLIFVAIINNIFVPIGVVASLNSSCFYDVFVAAPVVQSIFFTNRCFLTTVEHDVGDCILMVPVPRVMEYAPPFAYSYQCSSSLITSYAPTFMMMCLMNSVAIPLCKYLILQIAGNCQKGSQLYIFMQKYREFFPLIIRLELPTVEEQEQTSDRDIDSGLLQKDPIYRTDLLFCILSVNLGLLLTFGVVFPLLAVPFALSIFVDVYISRLELGRLVHLVAKHNLSALQAGIDLECAIAGSPAIVVPIIWMLVFTSCLFYTLFLFDTYGDVVGVYNAYWVVIVVPMLPVIAYAVYVYGWPEKKKTEGEESSGLRMTLADTWVAGDSNNENIS